LKCNRPAGAPYAYVTTPAFLVQFGFESLRDLPDIEKLEDAGLLGRMSADASGAPGARLDNAALLVDLAGALDVVARDEDLEEDAA
jgi:segregation and condensation protein B